MKRTEFRTEFILISDRNVDRQSNTFARHWYDAIQHFNVPNHVNLPWTDELDVLIQKANFYAHDMVNAGNDESKILQVKLHHGIFTKPCKSRGGTRAGAGRPKVRGLKRRTTTATDDEWQAMISARNEIRQRNKQTN